MIVNILMLHKHPKINIFFNKNILSTCTCKRIKYFYLCVTIPNGMPDKKSSGNIKIFVMIILKFDL